MHRVLSVLILSLLLSVPVMAAGGCCQTMPHSSHGQHQLAAKVTLTLDQHCCHRNTLPAVATSALLVSIDKKPQLCGSTSWQWRETQWLRVSYEIHTPQDYPSPAVYFVTARFRE